jgi:hypothetical protein
VATVCIEKLADGDQSCDTTSTNGTGTDQVLVKIRYPDYHLDFVFFTMSVDLESTAVSRYES